MREGLLNDCFLAFCRRLLTNILDLQLAGLLLVLLISFGAGIHYFLIISNVISPRISTQATLKS